MKRRLAALLLACLPGWPGFHAPAAAHGDHADDKGLISFFSGDREVILDAHDLAALPKHNLTARIGRLREKGGFYALGVQAQKPIPALALSLGGRAFDGDPTVTQDGLTFWWLVPAELLSEGDNAIGLAAAEAFAPEEVLMLALEHSGEEAHFGQIVQRDTWKAQPATDPQQDRMDVLHMDLTLGIRMDNRTVSDGAVEVTAKAIAPGLTQCVLDFNNNGGSYPVGTATLLPAGTPLTTTYSGNRIFVTLPAQVPVGETFTVRVPFSGTPAVVSGKGYIRSTHASVPIIYTHSQPYNGRDWWPSKDVPEDKFTIDLHITAPDTVYNGYPLFVTSNGKLDRVDANAAAGTNTFHWKETYPIASYLVAFNCTNYRAVTGTYTSRDGLKTMEMAHYLYPEIHAAESVELPRTIEVMNFFADTFGEYPFLEEKYWTATWTITFGLEHQTVTSMPSGNLNQPYHRRNIHEMSHMWFGDAITCHTYDELWLNEGWATYCEALFYEHLNGRAAYHSYVNNWNPGDSQPVVSSQADNFNNSVVYQKGGFILHMLRHQMGDDAFFAGTRAYLQDPALRYGTATTDQFRGHMEAAAGRSLAQFFSQWCYRASRPAFQWYWTQTGDNLSLFLNQTQTDDVYITPVDLQLVFSDSTTRDITVDQTTRAQSFTIPLSGKTVSSVTFDPMNYLHETNTRLTTLPGPAVPTLLTVRGNAAAGTATLTWNDQAAAANMLGHRLYRFPDSLADSLAGATLVADETVLGPSATSYIVSGLAAGEAAWYALTAVGPSETDRSDIYGVRLGTNPVLVVDAYDRWVTETANPSKRNHVFAAIHGKSIAAAGLAFDTIANESLGSVALDPYPMVDWVLGNESTTDETFSSSEQAAVSAYLAAGGTLFVSGSELAWDLDNRGTTADRAFCNNFLHVDYVSDNSGVYTVTGSGAPSPFGSGTWSFGSGDSLYRPGFPDTFNPIGGSSVVQWYGAAAGSNSGIFYRGPFGGSESGAVMVLGFGFETLNSQAERDDVMGRVVGALLPAPPSSVTDGFLIQ